MFPLCRPPISFFVLWWIVVSLATIYIFGCRHEDIYWLLTTQATMSYIVHEVWLNWNKPFKKTRFKSRTKGCARFYIRKATQTKESRIGTRRKRNIVVCLVPLLASAQVFPTSSAPSVDCCFTASSKAPNSIRFDSDSFQIAIDNCATSCFTNEMQDFIKGTVKQTNTKIMGIGNATSTCVGTVRWRIVDDQGRRHELQIPGTRYQESLPFRLLCPQHVAQTYKDPQTTCLTTMDKVIFVWGEGKWKRTLPLHKSSNVGIMWSAPGSQNYCAFVANPEAPHIIPNYEEEEEEPYCDDDSVGSDIGEPIPTQVKPLLPQREQSLLPQRGEPVLIEFGDDQGKTTEKEPQDITSKQAALRKCHCRLNHMPYARIQAMARHGLLPRYLATVDPPFCASCAYGKLTRKPWKTKGQHGTTTQLVPIRASGACVSVDQMESPTPGFVGQIKGWLTTKRYRAATVFVDHYSQLTFVYLQFSTAAEETVQAKKAFEAFAALHGIVVRHYHADNGRFAETKWLEAVHQHRPQQTVSFCGVGAHHQNGIAEKKIRDLQENARTMMLHAAQRWPAAHSVSLWPYAIRMAADAMNSTPRNDKSRVSPIERFANIKIRPQLRNFHAFGCPVYVLQAPLQTGQPVSKWLPRARLGIYIGMSPKHAKSVSLVLNPRTGLVSPQFHVKHDDSFETVQSLSDVTHGQWKKMAGFLNIKSGIAQPKPKTTMANKIANARPDIMLDDQLFETDKSEHSLAPSEGATLQEETESDIDFGTSEDENHLGDMDFGTQIDDVSTTSSIASATPTLRRSNRIRRPTWKVMENADQGDIALPAAYEVMNSYIESEIADEMADPIAFLAKTDPDTLYFHQAMKAEDSKEFRKAMQGEVDDHCKNKHWAITSRSKVPEGVKVLDSVWAMRRKRRIKTKKVYKWKARLNIHGGQQEYGVNYWETFAPVVTWLAIRLVLILSLLLSWHTRQIDFVLAYPQAPIETPLWMEVPKGVTLQGLPKKDKDYVLELKMNLYGQKQAGRVWYKYLTKGLKQLGFTPSLIDECVFYRNGTIFLVYVDDGIIAGPSVQAIDQIISDLQTIFKVSDEGDLTDYLGVNIEKREDGTIKLSQPHLIDQIIEDVNFQADTMFKSVPAATSKILNKDEGGQPHNAQWHYRAIIGKLNFLEKSTRGELGYAVHQCARFCESPTVMHTEAVHHIVRFLKGTRDEGIILDPKNVSFECYADADFCGLWNKQTAETDPTTAKSRMGYLLMFARCPLIWVSKLAGPYCLSTTEAEYISLSSALRQVIPVMDLLEEMRAQGIISETFAPTVFCKAFEDNSGALEMARMPRMRPRTKHINCSYHHFRSHVATGKITIHAIATEDQIADLWTKPLGAEAFAKFVYLAFGWDIKKANELAREQIKKLKKAKRGSL